MKADREGGLEVQDYRDAFASRVDQEDEKDVAQKNATAIPSLQPYIASGDVNAKAMPLVSISVNQSIPLRDVLFELSQQAGVDIELDPGITGGIIFTARQRPFDDVIDRISEVAGLRYTFENDVLRIEQDTPYNKLYKIDYLSYVRTNSSQISNDISVVSGDGTDTGSNFSSSAESEADFWGELEANITQIIGGANAALRTQSDPQISVAEQNPDVRAVSPDGENVSAPDAVLNVSALPVDGGNASGPAFEGEGASATFSVNKQAGLINVFANDKVHKEIRGYLDVVKKSVTAQVLIEAKVLEVSLSDEYATGINWNAAGLSTEGNVSLLSSTGDALLGVLGGGSSVTFPQAAVDAVDSTAFTASFFGNDIQALIGAISEFGTVKALASPRLTVLNNQSAVMNVATNRVFFEVEVDTTIDEGTVSTEVESEIRNVPEGVLINVQPSVDLSSNTVSLALRPTITKIDNTVDDPGLAVAIAECGSACSGISSPIPELNVQEIDSVIRVNSGQPIVMGGLLQDRVETNHAGVPVLAETPILGNLFKNKSDIVTKTELVILLKATILENPSDSVHSTDKDLYRKFSGDRRPFRF
ncbi:MAG: type II and III secretion system family protein [Alphaproteobacteria bacterium]